MKTFHVQAVIQSIWILLYLQIVAHVSLRTWQKCGRYFRYYTFLLVIELPKIIYGTMCSTMLLRGW